MIFVEKCAQSLKLNRESINRILRYDLHYHPFKLAITQSLKETDYPIQKSFAESMLDKTGNNDFNVKNLMMSDELYFYFYR